MTYMRSEDICTHLRTKFCAPTHAIFFEVPDATGARHGGFADAISMALWPSHGLEMHGYEIKVSKYDWKRELAKPQKAERFAAFCDKWWIVTSDEVIEDEDEIPANWGWMVASPDGLTVRKQATANKQPKAYDRMFVAALFRSAGKVDGALVESICQQRLKELRMTDEQRIKMAVDKARAEDARASKILDGVLKHIEENNLYFGDQTIIDAIVAVCKSGVSDAWGGLANTAEKLEESAKRIRDCHSSLGLPKHPKKRR
jgi:hypothetical protein